MAVVHLAHSEQAGHALSSLILPSHAESSAVPGHLRMQPPRSGPNSFHSRHHLLLCGTDPEVEALESVLSSRAYSVPRLSEALPLG